MRILAAVTSSVLIIAIISAVADDSFLSSVINTLTAGMSHTASSLFGGEPKKSYSELEQELEKLRSENAVLRGNLTDYYDVKRENDRLWKYYDLKRENPQFELIPASVIRRDPNDEFYSFTINAGSSDGVSENDPVVTENGIIGYISSAGYTTSRVCTILSPETSIGAINSRTVDSGIVTGNSLYCDDNLTTLTAISADSTTKAGDILISSGLSGIYPPNLILGEVVEIKVDSYDTTPLAIVRPFEDIRTVSDVVVVTDFTGKGEVHTQEGGES